MEKQWKKPSPELIQILESALSRIPCDRRMMFGSPVFMINRNMFTGVHEDHIFLRLDEADRSEIVKKFPGAAPFEPLKGHIMKEYIVLPPAIYGDKQKLTDWLIRAHAYAVSLPAKVSKRK